jgi:hypothetical protein
MCLCRAESIGDVVESVVAAHFFSASARRFPVPRRVQDLLHNIGHSSRSGRAAPRSMPARPRATIPGLSAVAQRVHRSCETLDDRRTV